MKLKNDYNTQGAHPDDAEDKEYEEQYNPAADFAIFGKGDPRGGAMQTMQEKMNLADDVDDNISSASDEGNEISAAVKERIKSKTPDLTKLTIVPEVDEKKVNQMEVDSASQRLSELGSQRPLTHMSGISTPKRKKVTPLPEDKEIQDIEEEDN